MKSKVTILDSSEFYTKEWEKYVELVLDDGGYVYERRIDMNDEFYSPFEEGGYYSKPTPEKYKYDPKRPIICLCGNKKMEIFSSGYYETSGRCLNCGKTFVVHSG